MKGPAQFAMRGLVYALMLLSLLQLTVSFASRRDAAFACLIAAVMATLAFFLLLMSLTVSRMRFLARRESFVLTVLSGLLLAYAYLCIAMVIKHYVPGLQPL